MLRLIKADKEVLNFRNGLELKNYLLNNFEEVFEVVEVDLLKEYEDKESPMVYFLNLGNKTIEEHIKDTKRGIKSLIEDVEDRPLKNGMRDNYILDYWRYKTASGETLVKVEKYADIENAKTLLKEKQKEYNKNEQIYIDYFLQAKILETMSEERVMDFERLIQEDFGNGYLAIDPTILFWDKLGGYYERESEFRSYLLEKGYRDKELDGILEDIFYVELLQDR